MADTYKPEGGQAFACASNDGHQPGMTMRQWYKGMALMGVLANPDCSYLDDAAAVRVAAAHADAAVKEDKEAANG